MNIQKQRNKKKVIAFISLISLMVSILGLILAYCDSKTERQLQYPSFSLALAESDSTDTNNKIFNISNLGGKISNAKLKADAYLVLDFINNKYKSGCYTIKFSDFYNTNTGYFFDYDKNCFTVKETGTDIALSVISELDRNLRTKGIYISDYAIQNYFYLSYEDYKGKKHNESYGISNNFNYYFWDVEHCKRYFTDNELLTVKYMPDPDIETVVDSEEIFEDDILKEQKHIFTKSTKSSDGPEVVILYRNSSDENFICDENGFAIGFKEGDDNEVKSIIDGSDPL